jgi:hypothetical protein
MWPDTVAERSGPTLAALATALCLALVPLVGASLVLPFGLAAAALLYRWQGESVAQEAREFHISLSPIRGAGVPEEPGILADLASGSAWQVLDGYFYTNHLLIERVFRSVRRQVHGHVRDTASKDVDVDELGARLRPENLGGSPERRSECARLGAVPL